jgi:hypothetical protein
VLAAAVIGTGGLQAATLWDNGFGFANADTTPHGICDSNVGCAGGATTAFDSFTITNAQWKITAFRFTDFFINSPTSDPSASFTSTTWSLWNGDPLVSGKLIATGTATGAANVLGSPVNANQGCSGQTCLVNFNVSITPVVLTSGTYYVGFSNNLVNSNSIRTERAYSLVASGVSKTLENSQQTNSLTVGQGWLPTGCATPNICTGQPSSFDVQGTLVPEPATWSLLLISAAGFRFLRRRSKV